MPLLVDTGVFVAAFDRAEARHADCSRLLVDGSNQLATTAMVVPETAWLLESRGGPAAEAGFLRLITTKVVQVIDLRDADYERALELVEQYTDLGLGTVDASIVAIAERLREGTIATLNHRDFRVVRPRHVGAFTLLP